MNPEHSKKINSNTVSNLQSHNTALIRKTLDELSEKGNSSYIPLLIELLHSTENLEIKKRIARLLSELKHSDAIPLIVDAIQNKQYVNELQYLVSACWENGMDYSNHLSTFVDLVVDSDFMLAFEAQTVIINMTGKISEAIYEREIKKIKGAMPAAEENKKQILQDLLNFLPELKEGISPETF